jgi:hypothetical protein
MHILMYKIFVHESGGRVSQIARAVGKERDLWGKNLNKNLDLKHIYLFKSNKVNNSCLYKYIIHLSVL